MKRIFLFGFLLLMILLACSQDMTLSPARSKSGTEIVVQLKASDTLFTGSGKFYVNLIYPNQCFYCSPVYSEVCHLLIDAGIPKDRIIYVFPDLRKVEQKKFLESNFSITKSDAKIVFSTAVYNQLKTEFGLNAASQMVCLNNLDHKTNVITYERNNLSSFESFLSGRN